MTYDDQGNELLTHLPHLRVRPISSALTEQLAKNEPHEWCCGATSSRAEELDVVLERMMGTVGKAVRIHVVKPLSGSVSRRLSGSRSGSKAQARAEQEAELEGAFRRQAGSRAREQMRPGLVRLLRSAGANDRPGFLPPLF